MADLDEYSLISETRLRTEDRARSAAAIALPTLEDLVALSVNLQRFFDMLEGLVW